MGVGTPVDSAQGKHLFFFFEKHRENISIVDGCTLAGPSHARKLSKCSEQ
jgi:hypothetical protein